MRNYYSEDTAQSDEQGAVDFPMMVALFLLEYLNSKDNRQTAGESRRKINNAILLDEPFGQANDAAITEEVITILKNHYSANNSDPLALAEPFVLPAIEHEDTQEASSSQ
jgi:hypothetical protein